MIKHKKKGKELFTIERQQEILNMIKLKKTATVKELSKKFFIGEATIRRDLEKLEKMGLLKRTYGGAVSIEGLDSEIPLTVRELEQKDAKQIIGFSAANLIKDGNIIVMDSSSTVLRMVPYLKGKKDLTVITNGAKTAVELGELLHIKVYCTGGLLRENSLSYIGESARSCIKNFNYDLLFFSCRAISKEKGLSDISKEEAELRRLMIENSKESVLLCDSSKFDKVSFCNICDIDNIGSIITERKPSSQWIDLLTEKGVNLFYG
jgi:DeoR/GlpR family transcriptional regulator of sugar metabolism